MLLTINIKKIGAIGFYYNLRKKENKFFSTSLYEIDCLIEEALQDKDKETREEIKKQLLAAYKDYVKVCFKVAFN